MSKTILITLNNSGNNPGPYIITLYDAFSVPTTWGTSPTKAQLTAGYQMSIPDNIVTVRVKSITCESYSTLTIPTVPTTTSTTSTTTTSTTSSTTSTTSTTTAGPTTTSTTTSSTSTTSTTSTTTAPPAPCEDCYEYTLTSDFGATVQYFDCSGTLVPDVAVPDANVPLVIPCAIEDSIYATSGFFSEVVGTLCGSTCTTTSTTLPPS